MTKSPRTRFPRRSAPLLAAVLVLTLLWRFPSFFDPPWVNDEGTYFAVARAMVHGFRLYSGVWENKPPAIYLLYEAVYRLLGPSLVGVRVLAALAALGTVSLVYGLAAHFSARERAAGVALLAGLLLGVPFLEGTTANAEIFLVLFATLGMYLALVRKQPAPAGPALAVAIMFKAVAGFDAIALGIWLLTHDRSAFARYGAVLIGAIGVAIVAAAAAGILSGLVHDAFLYDIGYVGHGNGGGVPWALGLKVVLLVGLTVALRRAAFPYLWLVWSTAGAMVSGRIFGHYLIQMVPPLCIVLGMLLPVRWVARPALPWIAGVFLTGALVSALAGWALVADGHDSIFARRLQYYANFARYALQLESRQHYVAGIDDHVLRNMEVSRALRTLPPGRLLVWGNTPWVYVLSGRLPATPYTSALRQPEVPGETASLRSAVARALPREVVVVDPPAPALGGAARALGRLYSRRLQVDGASIYVSVR